MHHNLQNLLFLWKCVLAEIFTKSSRRYRQVYGILLQVTKPAIANQERQKVITPVWSCSRKAGCVEGSMSDVQIRYQRLQRNMTLLLKWETHIVMPLHTAMHIPERHSMHSYTVRNKVKQIHVIQFTPCKNCTMSCISTCNFKSWKRA